MDLLESGSEREPRELLALRLPGWVVAAVAAGVAVLLVAGVLSAVVVERAQEREAARPDVAVEVLTSTSSTVGGVARGVIGLALVNRGRDEVQVDLGFLVEGLRVTGAVPETLPPIPPSGRQEVRVTYLVPSCASLVLPGRLELGLQTAEERVDRVLPVVDPRDRPPPPDGGVRVEPVPEGPPPDTLPLAACPPSSRSAVPGEPTDVGARSAGGSSRRVGPGAEGIARLEVRNGGPAVRLLSVDARVPGAVFAPRLLDGGLVLEPDGLALVGLRFRVPDCARLQSGGWLLLRVERFGGVQELALRIVAEPAGGLGPQAQLPVVLESCD